MVKFYLLEFIIMQLRNIVYCFSFCKSPAMHDGLVSLFIAMDTASPFSILIESTCVGDISVL